MQRLSNPMPIFLDRTGLLLDGGMIWIGAPNTDPTVQQITVYWDTAFTQVASQPLTTLGGKIVNGATPAFVYVNANDYAMTVQDSFGAPIQYTASAVGAGAAYQPLDTDLSEIAALTTTAFGRSLLTVPNAAALVQLLSLPAYLPLAGGTMTGDIKRQGAGTYVYNADPAATGGAIYVTNSTASDPTSNPGDRWEQTP